MVNVITNYGHLLIEALGQTLVLALCGLFFACIIGLIFGIMSVVKNRFCRAVSFVFVYAIRGVPMIVLAFFVFFGVPQFAKDILGIPLKFSGLQAGTICLSLNCGAYMSEIIRGGIQSSCIRDRWKQQGPSDFLIGARCKG